MSDPMTPEVRDWMKRSDAEPPDAQQSARQVMARLPEVRQRRRWWPFPVFYRKPQSPMTTDTTEHPPSPIPASDGHTPTVIGRTQSMLSPVKAITAGAVVFALGGVLLVAQPFDQQSSVPGAATDAADASPGSFTGSQTGFICRDEPDSTYKAIEGIEYASGSRCESQVISTDPRFSGTLSRYLSYQGPVDEVGDFDLYGFTSVSDTVYRLVDDEGAWQGHSPAFELQPCEFSAVVVALTGEGAYEGLTAVVEYPPISACAFDTDLRGVIFGGPLPPAWDVGSSD